jgi:RimJ/RimL family protein N-acetyltransferase
MNDRIRLRPIVESDLPVLGKVSNDPVEASEFGFFGFRNPHNLRKRFDAGFITEDGGVLAVVRDHEPGEAPPQSDGTSGPETADVIVGDVAWHRMVTGPNCATWNIGIALLAKERGKGYGTEAQRLLVEYLFSHTRYYRIEAGTETANLAEQRALEKAGFTREGVVRGACFRAGQWRDMVLYSIIRADLAT